MRNREIGLLETIKGSPENPSHYWDSELRIGLIGQNALSVQQWFCIERLYKNWDNWKIKLAVWLIKTTKL